MAKAQTDDVYKRMDAIDDKILALIARSKTKDPRLVGLRDEAFTLLDKMKLSYHARYNSMQMGVHPSNRGKAMVEAQNLPKKLKGFKKSGFSNPECARACAVERSPKPIGDDYESQNARLARESDGQLAPVETGSLRGYSMTCGHTNQALRAVVAEIPCDDPEISVNGYLNKAKFANDAVMIENLEAGMTWRMIKWEVEDKWPELIELIIEADNVPFSSAKVANKYSMRVIQTL